jgi:hypothetical protein
VIVPPVQIFISYARDDDGAPPDDRTAKGFVTSLHDQLCYEFRQLGQPNPALWCDTRNVDRGDQFEPMIEEAIAGSSFLVVMLSRNWLGRPWCRRELESFARRWAAEGDGVRKRIVVVARHYIKPEDRPDLLQGQTGYAFFDFEGPAEPGKEIEFFDRGAIRDPRYKDLVRDLASNLWRLAQRLSPAGPTRPSSASTASVADSGRKIFLSKPAADMRQAYLRLIEELARRDYVVVPDANEQIPNDSSAIAFVDKALAEAELSVHLLGDKSGYAPEDADPIVKLQLARAAIRAKAAGDTGVFHRVIWAPRIVEDGTPPGEAASGRDPLAVLTRLDGQLATDKIEGDNLTKFTGFLFQHLDRATHTSGTPTDIGSDGRVYVYHCPADTGYAVRLAKALQERQIQPTLPALEGDPAELIAFHRRNLVDCDSVILCWGAASEVWARATSLELRNWRDLGRSRKFSCRALVVGPPPGDRKTVFAEFGPRNEIDVVVDLSAADRPSPESLDPLISAARAIGP